jgi:hypothetical protein
MCRAANDILRSYCLGCLQATASCNPCAVGFGE